MKVNDILDLTIVGQGMDGEGVARVDGIVVFVPYTLIGEVVKCKVTQVKKSFANAKVIKVVKPSALRVAPECSAYFKCGGCDFLHIAPGAHARLKQAELVSNFKKIANEDITVGEYVESDKMCGYRNKVQLPFGIVNGVIELGYFANKTHEIVRHERCVLHADWADKLSKIVLNFVRTHQISVYDERTGKGLMRHLVMRKVGGTVAVVLVINGDSVPFIKELVKDIEGAGIAFSLHININREDTNVIMSDTLTTIYGDKAIEVDILGVKAEISPLSFMQVNDYIMGKIYRKAMELMSCAGVAIDLYSGIGITSNILAKTCDSVYSIEIVKDAADDAVANAKRNGNDGKITTICGDAQQELPKLLEKLRAERESLGAQNVASVAANCADSVSNEESCSVSSVGLSEANVQKTTGKDSSTVSPSAKANIAKNSNGEYQFAVLIDPPRKGCEPSIIDALLQAAPDRIVYISCNSATLARDFARLKPNYTITDLSAYDMFPNTHHIECLVCLSKKA